MREEGVSVVKGQKCRNGHWQSDWWRIALCAPDLFLLLTKPLLSLPARLSHVPLVVNSKWVGDCEWNQCGILMRSMRRDSCSRSASFWCSCSLFTCTLFVNICSVMWKCYKGSLMSTVKCWQDHAIRPDPGYDDEWVVGAVISWITESYGHGGLRIECLAVIVACPLVFLMDDFICKRLFNVKTLFWYCIGLQTETFD